MYRHSSVSGQSSFVIQIAVKMRILWFRPSKELLFTKCNYPGVDLVLLKARIVKYACEKTVFLKKNPSFGFFLLKRPFEL